MASIGPISENSMIIKGDSRVRWGPRQTFAGALSNHHSSPLSYQYKIGLSALGGPLLAWGRKQLPALPVVQQRL